MSRSSICTTELDYDNNKIGKIVKLEDYSLVIPLLSKGRRGVTKGMRYIANAKFRREIVSSNNKHCHGKIAGKKLPSVTLNIDNQGAQLPCLSCKMLNRKLIDTTSCALGSSDCLRSIVLGSGSDFSETLTGLTKAEVEQQLAAGGNDECI